MSLLNNKLTKVNSPVKLKTHFLILLMNLPHVTRIIKANKSIVRSYCFPNWRCSKGSKVPFSCKSQSTFCGRYLFCLQAQNVSQSKSTQSRQQAFAMLHTAFFHGIKRQEICSSATSVDFQRTAWRHVTEDRTLQLSDVRARVRTILHSSVK
jgi:hypothetical protein